MSFSCDKFANRVLNNSNFDVFDIIEIQNRIDMTVILTCKLYLYQEIDCASWHFPFFGWCWSECDVTYGTLAMGAIVCWQSEADCVELKSEPNVWNTSKLSCVAQQVGIVHFYVVTEIKGLSCRLWMREWRNLLILTLGSPGVMWAVASGGSLKFGVQCASVTDWFPRVII